MTTGSPLAGIPGWTRAWGSDARRSVAHDIFRGTQESFGRLDTDSVSVIAGRARCRFWRVSGILALAAVFAVPFGVPSVSADPKGPVRSLLEMRTQGVILQKADLSCGAAALATLLNFQFGDHVTERQVTEGLIRRREYIEQPELVRLREGFSLLDMKRYVTGRGYNGIGYGKLEFDDLIPLAPIIVAISPIGYNHFVVFKGTIGDRVLLADSAFGNRTMSREKFERVWIDFPEIGKVGFIVTRTDAPAPPGQLTAHEWQLIAPTGDLVRQALQF
jgi:predicted double-glycine peptidase